LLTHPTHEALNALKLDGMAEAFAELITQDRGRSLDPVAWIGLMLDREQARRGTRRFQSRLRAANLRHGNACMEDVDYRTPRGLDRALFQSLDGTDWIEQHRSVLITGPCGVGKSWLACALGHAASRADRTVLYHRLPRLFADLELARGDGRFDRLFRKIARVDLLILDDWGPERLTAPQRRDLMEIVEERYGRRSTIVTSQLPVGTWHEVVGEPTFADAILDRLVHNAYRIALDGPSLRKSGAVNGRDIRAEAAK
jgi:DNA replication protein DnaC